METKISFLKKYKFKILGLSLFIGFVVVGIVLLTQKKDNTISPSSTTPSSTTPPIATTPPPPCKKRTDELYCGCGYCYASKSEFIKQCAGSRPDLPPSIQTFIGDSLPNQNPCTDLKRLDPLYCGCGYCYGTKKDHLEQCVGGNTNSTPTIQKWIGDGVV